METLALVVYLAIAVVVLSPIIVIVLQSRVLRQQKKASLELESWRVEIRRELRESRRLMEDFGRRVQPAGLASEPEPQARGRRRACGPDRRNAGRARVCRFGRTV